MSKYFGPDLRFAYVAGDALTMRKARVRRSVACRRVSGIIQHVVLRLLQDENTLRQVKHAGVTYNERRIAMQQALQAVGVTSRGSTGMHLWIPAPDEALVAQALSQRGWLVRSGRIFRLSSPQAIRVTASAIPADLIGPFATDLAHVMTNALLDISA
jgi:DNA-binding transcriptional MocR family regulator